MVKIGGSGSYSTITLLGRGATNLLRFANNQRNDLSVIKHFLVREQNFIMANGADIVQAGNIFGQQNSRDAAACARAVDASRRKIFACACGEQTGQTSSIPAGCAISST